MKIPKKFIKKNIIAIVVGIIAIIGFGLFFLNNSTGSRAAVEQVILNGQVVRELSNVNEQVHYQLLVTAPSNKFIDGADMYIEYPTNLLDYVSYSIVDNYFEYKITESTTTPGQLHIARGTTKYIDQGVEQRKTSFTLDVVFTTKAVGQGNVTLKNNSLFTGVAPGSTIPSGYGMTNDYLTAFQVATPPTVTVTPIPPSNTPEPPTSTPAPGSPTITPTDTVDPTPTSAIPTVTNPVASITSTTPSDTPVATVPPTGCTTYSSLHGKGDANCDGVIDSIDYAIWRKYYTVLASEPQAFNPFEDPNFNNSGTECKGEKNGQSVDLKTCLVDLELWTNSIRN